jgi:hypothetical protein
MPVIQERLVKERALFATTSRLVATLINEGLMLAILHSKQADSTAEYEWTWALIGHAQSQSTSCNAPEDLMDVIVIKVKPVAMRQSYMCKRTFWDSQVDSLLYVDPADILGPVCVSKAKIASANGRLLLELKDGEIKRSVTPREVMHLGCRGMQYDHTQFQRICLELENSVVNQGIFAFIFGQREEFQLICL